MEEILKRFPEWTVDRDRAKLASAVHGPGLGDLAGAAPVTR